MIDATKLFDWLEEQGYQPELVEDDEEIIICCPLCHDDRPRFYVSVETGAWLCFHCHEEGSLYRLLHAVGELPTSEAFELSQTIANKKGQDNLDDFFDVRKIEEKAQAPAVLTLPPSFQPIAGAPQIFKNYLQGRGITPQLAVARGMGYAVSGRFAQRIIIPNLNDGHLYTFIARTVLTACPNCAQALDECLCRPYKYPKVLTPTKKQGATPSLTLFNLDAVRASGHRPVVVMEGWADALMLPHQAVALSTSRASHTQLTLLAGLGRRDGIIICLDPDEAGYLGAIQIADSLTAELVDVKIALLDEEGGDANKGGIARLKSCIAAARSYTL